MELAKAVGTLDVLTDGRVMCTFGAGYTEGEFAAVGAEFARRGQVCDEYLEAMIELWESPNPAYDGEFVRFRDVVLDPRPRRRPPIWLGGDAHAVLRFADGWYPWLTPPGQIPSRLAYIKEQPEFEARPRAFEPHYSLSALLVSRDHGARFENQEKVFEQPPQRRGHDRRAPPARRPGCDVDISPAAAPGRPRGVSRPPAVAGGADHAGLSGR